AEHTAFPRRLEDQLAVLARHRDGAFHVGDETVGLDVTGERGRRNATGRRRRRIGTEMKVVHGLAVGPGFPGGGGGAIPGAGGARRAPPSTRGSPRAPRSSRRGPGSAPLSTWSETPPAAPRRAA